MEISTRLKEIRDSFGLSQKEFAERLRTNQRNLSKYETGGANVPDELKQVLASFGVNLHWLVTGDGEPFLPNQKPFPLNNEQKQKSEPAPDERQCEPAPPPVVCGPGGLVLKQGTTPFPSLKKADLTDATLFPKTSRYIAAAHAVPMKLSMKAVEPEQGAVVVAHGTRIIRVEQEADDDVYMVPYLEQCVSAGPGAEPTQISETRLAPVPSRIAYPYPPDDILSAEVRGDSMTGVGLFDGDIVYFVRTDRVADGLYVLTVAGEIFVKRLEIDHFAGEIRIISENERYQPKIIKEESYDLIHVEGKVIGWIHRHPY
jgi:phage repressor protein C with HTH and peptisase S24 domain/transcriptional regulator with XRE-family HTH domain